MPPNKHVLTNFGPALTKLQLTLPFWIFSVSLEAINCILNTAQAICKVLSAKILYYTVSVCFRISSLPEHDVPQDEL